MLALCVLMGVAPVALIGWYLWDSAQNRGFEFGYFGAFNRIQHALAAIPGTTITRDWSNSDVTLEEFGFHVTTSTWESLHLDFQEADPIRDLSGQQLVAALIAKIQQKPTSTSLK